MGNFSRRLCFNLTSYNFAEVARTLPEFRRKRRQSTSSAKQLLFTASTSIPTLTVFWSRTLQNDTSSSAFGSSTLSISTVTLSSGTPTITSHTPIPDSALPGHEGLGKRTAAEVVGMSLGGLVFLILLAYFVRHFLIAHSRMISKPIPIRYASESLFAQSLQPETQPKQSRHLTYRSVDSIRPESSASNYRPPRNESYIDLRALERFVSALPSSQNRWEESHAQIPTSHPRTASNNAHENRRVDEPLPYQARQKIHQPAPERNYEQVHLRPVGQPEEDMNRSQVRQQPRETHPSHSNPANTATHDLRSEYTDVSVPSSETTLSSVSHLA